MNIDTSEPLYVILYSAIVSAVFTAGIMVLNVYAQPTILRNQRLYRREGLLRILLRDPEEANLSKPVGEMSADEIDRLYNRRVYEATLRAPGGSSIELLTAYRSDIERAEDGSVNELPPAEDVIGYATRIEGTGFWETISGYLALGAQMEFSRGIVILQQAETPGLGARITKPEFENQFAPERRLRIDPPESGGKFLYIDQDAPAGEESPEYGRHVDALSGATQTSIRVEEFVNRDLQAFYAAVRDGELVTPEGAEAPPPVPPLPERFARKNP